MPMTYEDFDLHIWREGDRYAVEVTKSPAGPSEREYVSWPFSNRQDQELLQLRLENAILKSRHARSGAILTAEERTLREFGADIFKAIFRDSGSVASAYNGSSTLLKDMEEDVGLRINLRVDPPEIAGLPWEYVFDDRLSRNYVCLHSRSPVVRRLGSATGRAIRVRNPVRVLAMLVNLSGDLALRDAEKERRHLESILQSPGVELIWNRHATPESLIDLIQKGPWDIFHFIGHGDTEHVLGTDNDYHSQGYVVMDDGVGGPVKVWASELARILEDGRINLAVLNCCESARGNHSTSVGAALVAGGIPMAIAMQFAITDSSAACFSERFYGALAKGEPVERALTVARMYMRTQSDAEWAIPVLFTQADPCVLFKPESITVRKSGMGPSADPERLQAQAELRRLWSQS